MKLPEKRIHIGTSGWQYDHWKGAFYPDTTAHDRMLDRYSKYFDTVEINATFYRLPTDQTVQGWVRKVPGPFIFALKASRYITHMKKLKDPRESIDKFFSRIALLGNKSGPVLFQLPPNWKKNEKRLGNFLKELPAGYRYAFEFRHASWFDDDILTLLEDYGAALCLYDMGGKESPLHVISDFIYVRLHGAAGKYQGNYTEELLQPWADRISEWAGENREVFCYFNNDASGYAPLNALKLIEMLHTNRD